MRCFIGLEGPRGSEKMRSPLELVSTTDGTFRSSWCQAAMEETVFKYMEVAKEVNVGQRDGIQTTYLRTCKNNADESPCDNPYFCVFL